jgi:hypothetical protein
MLRQPLAKRLEEMTCGCWLLGKSAPLVAINFGCCASAITPRASNTTATTIDGTAAFFIAHLVSSVMYHADRDKGKCVLDSGRR